MERFIFFLAYLFLAMPLLAAEGDTTKSDPWEDSSSSSSPEVKDYGIIVSGGLGSSFIIGRPSDAWDKYFNSGSVYTLGIEIPITRNNYFSLQVQGFRWYSKSKVADDCLDKIKNSAPNSFKKSGDSYYSYGESVVFKTYLMKYNSNFRVAFHFGIITTSEAGITDMGVSMYYRLDENFDISLERRVFTTAPIAEPLECYYPDMLTLGANYRIRI
ncbi:MAG: hypothetical protein ACM3U1_07695 [Chloroflexota bacterium]